MADIEMREERLRIQAQLMSDKQAKRRTQQMSGFQVSFLKKMSLINSKTCYLVAI